MITAVRNEKYITRNISQFKKVNWSLEGPDVSDGYESEMSDDAGGDDGDPGPPVVNQPPGHAAPARRYPAREKHAFHRYGQNVYEQ